MARLTEDEALLAHIDDLLESPDAEALAAALARMRTEQEKLERKAYTDALTGLGNRESFNRAIDDVWQRNAPVTMAFVDIDNLKFCNDHFGHEEGDRYILQASLLLKLNCEPGEGLYRIGGDEFVLLSEHATEGELAARLEVCRDLLVNSSSMLEGMTYSYSYGVSHADPALGDTSRQMMSEADKRMYAHKLANDATPRGRAIQGALGLKEGTPLGERVFEALSMLNEGRYLFVCNVETGQSHWSGSAMRDFGLPSEHMSDALEKWTRLVHPDDRVAFRESTAGLYDGGSRFHALQYRVQDSRGVYAICDSRAYRIDGLPGEPPLVVGEIVNRGVAETTDAATGLGTNKSLLMALSESKRSGGEVGIVGLRVEGVSQVNGADGYEAGDRVLATLAGNILSFTRGRAKAFRARGMQFAVVADNMDKVAFDAFAKSLVKDLKQRMEGDAAFQGCDVHSAQVHYQCVTVQPATIVHELFRRLRPVRRIRNVAEAGGERIDGLTGLYRGSEFLRKAAEFRRLRRGKKWCVMAIDLGHLAIYNEWNGRDKGDALLAEVGSALKDIENEQIAISGYWGQDDFSMLAPFEKPIIQEMYARVRDVVAAHDDSIGFLPSVGIYPLDKDEPVGIDELSKAMFADKRAKRDFKNRIAMFQPGEYHRNEEERHLLTDFQFALSERRVTFYVQPQCSIETGEIVGGEALARWSEPDGSFVSPAEFVPALERSGFIVTLDKFVWRSVIEWIRACLDRSERVVPISINVSRVDVVSFDVAGYLDGLLAEFDVPTKYVKVEITETAYVKEQAAVASLVADLRARGIRILMDDFGSGESSLGMLKDTSIDVIKLDRSFMPVDEGDEKAIGIVASMISMARVLGLPIIVEGLETEGQRSILRRFGVGYAQGFLLHRPMPAADFEKLL